MADDAAKQADAAETASLRAGSLVLSAIAFVLGVLFLAGWYFDIRFLVSVRPQWPAIRPVSCICIILTASILASLSFRSGRAWLSKARLGGILLIAAICLASACVDHMALTGGEPSFVLTRFLNHVLDEPWRLTPLAATLFAFLAGALALAPDMSGASVASGNAGRRAADAAHALALLSIMISYLVLVGYLFGVKSFYRLYGVPLPLPTSIATLILGLGTLCANSRTWLMRVIVSRQAGGAVARRLLPTIVLILLGIGWLRMLGEENGLFSSPGGAGFAVVLNTSLFLAVVWLTARSSNRLDENRRKGELALRDSESHLRSALDDVLENQERLRHLAENVREVFWLGVPDGNEVLYVNPAYETVWGRPCQSLYENPRAWLLSVVEEDRPAVEAALGTGVFGQEATVLPEYRIVRPDGSLRWILAWAWPILDKNGKLHRVGGIAEDITHRKRTEEAEAKYRALVEESLVGVYLIQGDKFVYVNPRLAEIFGYAQNEIEGLPVLDLVSPADRPLVAQNMRQRLTGQTQSTHYVFRGLRKDRRIIDVEVIGSITSYSGDRAIIGSLQDVTERKRTEEELKKTAAELARSNQDLEQFAYMTSHDLQEPLRMVRGHLEVVQRQLAGRLDDSTRESMFYAMDGAVRMDTLIRDLLAYSRVGRGGKGFTPTDMEAVLAYALGNLKASIAEAHAIVTHDPLPTLKAETALISQLFQNLIGNAVKYRSNDAPPLIHVGSQREGRGWLFCVRDNGIGIAPEDQERVFMIFQRLHTRQQYPGTGVGLAICKRIVEHHCGRIWVESEPGRGSTFCFTIPDRD